MNYKIKEIYYTIQGEGFHTGRPAVFCRFSGCNLWSGKEEHRADAVCKFCDTDFWGTDGKNGGTYTAEELSKFISALYPQNSSSKPFVVFTGGEPALQLDVELIAVMHQSGFEIAVETNGTLALPENIDWICVSPKADTNIVTTRGHELKLVFPQIENKPESFVHLDFKHFYVQPLDNEEREHNTRLCVEFCLAHPQWKLSLQTHKYLGID